MSITGEKEIFFFQKRVGKAGKIFSLFKFATMLKNSPNIGTGTLTIKDDERVLPFGKFLRSSKINELPQLFNIFIGHMSIIGPRPLTQNNFNYYSESVRLKITKVKPGLSGIGSIVFRKEEEIISSELASDRFYENVISPYKGKLEEWYVDNRNLKIYFFAIFITVWTILFSNSSLVWNILKNLPEPPDSLKNLLNFQ